MFTGIVEETGRIRSVSRGSRSCVLTVEASKVLEGTAEGDSISTNGICLTVTRIDRSSFTADVMPETMNRTSLGSLKPGDRVNLERAMPCNGRFGGHIVSGHIDGTGRILGKRQDDNAVVIAVGTSADILKYIVEKGSIAIDGISLTVVSVDNGSFTVSVIPHTAAETTLLDRKPGDTVNLENDIVAKYVERFITLEKGHAEDGKKESPYLNLDYLSSNGF